MKRERYTLVNDHVRKNAIAAIMRAPTGHSVTVAEPSRSLDQNAKFHAICTDIARSEMEWAGKRRSADDWKVLLVSAHTKATDGETEFLIGLEGEFVNIRESTARMGVARAASLIEYALAFCGTNSIPLTETRRTGYMEQAA